MSEQMLMTLPAEARSVAPAALLHGLDGLVSRRLTGLPCDGEAIHPYRVQLAQSAAQHRTASLLVQRMYAWRGYQGVGGPLQDSPQRTLVVSEGDSILGTLSVAADKPGYSLSVEQSFPQQVAELRRAGHRLCEFTKLAVDGEARSKELLGSLFHAAYRYADNVHRAETVLVEVNPRHVRFYARLLGFEVVSGVQQNDRVNAPAVLLTLNLAYGLSEIARLGGKPHLAAVEKSFYPYFLAPEGEVQVFIGNWARSRSA
ncbi:N-acyl amino acid synthase FeeM domain-containing protein [Azohydromonas aeria]|uniref:N-acyl amino acid synthase FeeM domain-containing protein n=1 Tax=Azohydromonas aeria TaxID=2590212 RepID=UPI0012FCF6E7|nr:hypothetical protein [Azohydromonas aeria]